MSDPAIPSPVIPRRMMIVHPAFVRVTHWINAAAITVMVASGWRIYNASPLFDFRFPDAETLGGWLGGAIAWHFAAMWVLVANGLVYLTLGLLTGHFRRDFLPLTPKLVLRDLAAALTFRLAHRAGRYNAVQKLLYLGVIGVLTLAVASGLAVWKPVQLQSLAALFGGYEGARLVHFTAMTGIVAFVAVHLTLVILVPKTLLPMIIGRARIDATEDRT